MRDDTRQAQETIHAEGSDRQAQQAHSRDGTYREGGAHRQGVERLRALQTGVSERVIGAEGSDNRPITGKRPLRTYRAQGLHGREVQRLRVPQTGPLREGIGNPLTESGRTVLYADGGLGAHRRRSRRSLRTGSIPLTSMRSLVRRCSRPSVGIDGHLWPYPDVDDVQNGVLWPYARGCDAVSESQDVDGVILAEGSDSYVLAFREGRRPSTGRVFDLPRRRPRVLFRRNNGSLSETGPNALRSQNKGSYLGPYSPSAGPYTGPQQAPNRRLRP